jgi:hypothetical protein
VGQFVDALKTSIINGFALEVWVKLIVRMMVLLFWITYSHCSGHLMLLHQGKETPESFHVAQQVQKDTGAAVHAGDMEVFSVAYVSGSIARQVLRGVSCDACKTCLTEKQNRYQDSVWVGRFG